MSHAQSTTKRQECELATKCQEQLQATGTTGEPIERLRLRCLSRGATGILGLGRILRRMKQDGSKQLNCEEFLTALQETGMDIGEDEAIQLFESFDDKSHIDIHEFLLAIRPPMSDSRKEIIAKAFKKMDKSGDGVITIEDLKKCYNVNSQSRYISGEDSEESILNVFMGNFEKGATKDGNVTEEEFHDYYSAISASIDNDCYFDLMMRQAYKL